MQTACRSIVLRINTRICDAMFRDALKRLFWTTIMSADTSGAEENDECMAVSLVSLTFAWSVF